MFVAVHASFHSAFMANNALNVVTSKSIIYDHHSNSNGCDRNIVSILTLLDTSRNRAGCIYRGVTKL